MILDSYSERQDIKMPSLKKCHKKVLKFRGMLQTLLTAATQIKAGKINRQNKQTEAATGGVL